MKLSIIIPIYNIRDYIVKCVESCIHQEYMSQYEIILVDDETKDDSVDLVMPYVKKYENIFLVRRKNGGLSAARNSGLKVANGEYIWFVDGDDYIEDNAIGKLLSTMSVHKCDMFILGYNSVVEGNITNSTVFNLSYGIINGHEEFLKGNFSFPMLVWAHVYRTEFLKNNSLYFCEGIIHEDIEFKFCSHYLAKSILEIKEPLYNYRLARKNSIMSNTSKNPQISIDSNSVIIRKFLSDCDKLQVSSNVKRRYLSEMSLLALERILDQTNDIIHTNRDKVKELIGYLLHSNQTKRKVFAILCILLPSHFVRRIMHFYQSHR